MKAKFSNAEKVSDKFLKIRYEEFKKRLSSLKWTRFVAELDKILASDEDNYEKLKKIIHLERDFDNYIRSKEFFFDLMKMEFSDDNVVPYTVEGFDNNLTVADDANYYPVCDATEFLDLCISGLIKGKEYWDNKISEQDKEKIYYYLNWKYMQNRQREAIVYLIKILSDSDIIKFKEILRSHFANIFKKIMSSDEETLKAQTEGYLSRNIIFNSKVSDQTITFIANVNMEVFWESFDYPLDDERANSFRKFIKEKLELSTTYFAKCKEFWYLLLNFGNFCTNINQSNYESKDINNQPKADAVVIKRKKITNANLEEIVHTNIWYNLDLSEIDLSGIDLTDKLIIDCNLEGSGAKIVLTDLNQNSSVHYIYGKPIDRYNLVNSCFKGCIIENADSQTLNKFTFSSNTFDNDVALRCDPNLESVDENIREKYFRKIVPSEPELEVLFINHVDAVRRYGDLISDSKYTWLIYFNKVSKMLNDDTVLRVLARVKDKAKGLNTFESGLVKPLTKL